jgi:hypothetical protein
MFPSPNDMLVIGSAMLYIAMHQNESPTYGTGCNAAVYDSRELLS